MTAPITDPAAAARAVALVSRILIGMAVLAFVLAVLAALFGEQLKPLGEIADGLGLWHVIGLCFVLMGVSNLVTAVVMRRQADATKTGPKR